MQPVHQLTLLIFATHKPGHLVQHEISYKLNLSKMITYTQLQMISQEQQGCHKHKPQTTHMQDTHQKLITRASRGMTLLFLQKEIAFRPNTAVQLIVCQLTLDVTTRIVWKSILSRSRFSITNRLPTELHLVSFWPQTAFKP